MEYDQLSSKLKESKNKACSILGDGMNVGSEIIEIERTVNLYLEGLYERKFNLLEEAFWKEARNIGVTAENEFWFKTMEFWQEKCKRPIDQKTNSKRELIIENIDVWHNSAVARVKMVIIHPTRIYECTDFLSLLKIDGKWKIISKLWSARNIPK